MIFELNKIKATILLFLSYFCFHYFCYSLGWIFHEAGFPRYLVISLSVFKMAVMILGIIFSLLRLKNIYIPSAVILLELSLFIYSSDRYYPLLGLNWLLPFFLLVLTILFFIIGLKFNQNSPPETTDVIDR